ncbi:hypothetical protein B0T19DRAFT_426765 [Cercophora scortea]|uniref:Uncharacterized protein n=1 Tax=Cercophora scortea TaxID=314031 RepID=A0AAE0IER4_9PEZI|nr:hypothetical protein B0T19DRAFT_426765 [Cercophora scortea]
MDTASTASIGRQLLHRTVSGHFTASTAAFPGPLTSRRCMTRHDSIRSTTSSNPLPPSNLLRTKGQQGPVPSENARHSGPSFAGVSRTGEMLMMPAFPPMHQSTRASPRASLRAPGPSCMFLSASFPLSESLCLSAATCMQCTHAAEQKRIVLPQKMRWWGVVCARNKFVSRTNELLGLSYEHETRSTRSLVQFTIGPFVDRRVARRALLGDRERG